MFGHSKGKYIFDATEIRSAFALVGAVAGAHPALGGMIGWLRLSGKGSLPLAAGRRLVVHVVPLASFAAGGSLRRGHEEGKPGLSTTLHGRQRLPHQHRRAPEVHRGRAGAAERATAYCQVFRSGIVEGVTTEVVQTREPRPYIASQWLAQEVVSSVKQYRAGLIACDVLPRLVLATLAERRTRRWQSAIASWSGSTTRLTVTW